ncbi:MAG: 16S rRNA (cytidine(1402)-2'-O)-methyltransferase [Planctomycetes bacterium]|nr:16S rRNA (cytidine(1402)-2'-O)-methyltransferase [Planctomycetota bacterium]
MLYLVATPIGNLSDISQRALQTLAQADYVASEDTRKTGMLLARFDIKRPQISFHEHNKQRACRKIVGLLEQGRTVALVTNAGTPGISDPGFTLVRAALEAGVQVTMVPGPTAFVIALVLSGLPTHAFTFRGFAPRKSGRRQSFLAIDKNSPHTLIFYESPHRLRAFLADALEVLGDRRAALAKELTKMFESVKRGRLSELLANLDEAPKGEYTIVIAGAQDKRPKGSTNVER